MLAPPVPNQCDACSKPLAQPLICGRCKGYAYCNRNCQSSDWGAHKTGCSALPSGELVPAKVKWFKARADEVQRLEGVFRHYGRKLEPIAQAQDDVALAGLLEATLPDFKLAPAFATPPIPGQPANNPTDPELILRQLSRIFLLHDLSILGTSQARDIFDPVRPWPASVPDRDEDGRSVGRPMRLHGPKVLAVPEGLSMDEYGAVARRMGEKDGPKVPGLYLNTFKWAGLRALEAAVARRTGAQARAEEEEKAGKVKSEERHEGRV